MAIKTKDQPICQTEPFTKDRGWETNVMDLVSKFGLMVLDMKGFGKMTKLMDAVNSSTQTVMCMTVTGSTTKPKVKVLTHIQMERTTKANGWTINNMAMELKVGPMVRATRATMKTVKKKEWVN